MEAQLRKSCFWPANLQMYVPTEKERRKHLFKRHCSIGFIVYGTCTKSKALKIKIKQLNIDGRFILKWSQNI